MLKVLGLLGLNVRMKFGGRIKKGELNGFSMFGKGNRFPTEIEIEIPDSGMMKGDTEIGGEKPHTHEYLIKFSKDGKFAGGETGLAIGGNDEHTHRIIKGTATEKGGKDEHQHRFIFIDSKAA